MTYRGHIKRGVAVLDGNVKLPEGTPVAIEVIGENDKFWRGQSLDELIEEQGVQPIGDIRDLAVDWPEDESIDEFLALIREVRR